MLASFVLFIPLLFQCNAQTSSQEWKATISQDSQYKFNFFWNKCAGSGHAALSLREDWQQQIQSAHNDIGLSSVRMHGILDDDVGSVNGVNDYSFVNIDIIYDYLLSINMKPFVEISFMPNAFASNTTTVFHYKGNITPPKDWNVWYSFIQQWMQHLVARYGIDEVKTWKFEVWNEPNCGFYYQNKCCGCTGCGSFNEYMALYSNTSFAIKSVDPLLQVGGPSTARLCWLQEFLNRTVTESIPVDFISSHLYPTAVTVNASSSVNAFYETLKSAGLIIGAFNAKYNTNLKMYLSEFNSGLYGKKTGVDNHDNNYAAAFMVFHAQILQRLVNEYDYEMMSYWTFSDIFSEQGFNSNPFGNVFGMKTIRNIDKPVFRALQLLHEFGSDIGYNITRNDGINNVNGTVQMFLLQNPGDAGRYMLYAVNWNFNGQPIKSVNVSIEIHNLKESSVALKSAVLYRIDELNGNPVNEWVKMGSPEYPNQEQLNSLNVSSQFVFENVGFKMIDQNTVEINSISIPAIGVVAIDLVF